MKQITIILFCFLSICAYSQSNNYEPDKTYPKATCLEEVVYDQHGIPVNSSPHEFRKMKRKKERERRKYYGGRPIDNFGKSLESIGIGLGKAVAYTAVGVISIIIVKRTMKEMGM